MANVNLSAGRCAALVAAAAAVALSLLASPASASLVVYTNDFDGAPVTAPGVGETTTDTGGFVNLAIPTVDPGGLSHTWLDAPSFGLTGNYRHHDTVGAETITVVLTGLPAHTGINVSMFLNADGGLDNGDQDTVEIAVDASTVYDETFHGRDGSNYSNYSGDPYADGIVLARRSDGTSGNVDGSNGFDSVVRTGAWGHESLYDLGLDPRLQNIAHTSDTLTLTITSDYNTSGTDEQFLFANLQIELILPPVPEPASAGLMMLSLGSLGALGMRRRRPA